MTEGTKEAETMTVTESLVVDCDPEVAFDLFFKEVWETGKGGPSFLSVKVTKQGDENKIGHERVISPGGITEKITAYEKPTHWEYEITAGPIPTSKSTGRVSFEPVEGDDTKTKVTCKADFIPKYYMGAILKFGLSNIFKQSLVAFQKIVKEKPEAQI